MSHGDAVTRAPEGFRVTAHTDADPDRGDGGPERGLCTRCSSTPRSRTRRTVRP